MNKKYLKKKRIFKRIYGTLHKPRLTVFRSNKHFYAQLIDDKNHKTLLSISTNNSSYKKPFSLNCSLTENLGKDFGNKIIDSNLLNRIVFDKNKWPYHGRIKSFAQGVRQAGIIF